jgi:hypothetical protein
MNKLIKYKIAFAANLTISGIIIGFTLAVSLTGVKLVLAILMIMGGYLCALAMYLEMRKIKKLNG